MDASIHRSLTDKLYDRRKAGALDLENIIREASANKDHDRIKKIIHQLCQEYAYAVHQPYARNGGLIGLAAAAIALGPVRLSRSTPSRRFRASADFIAGGRSLPRGDCPTCPRMFHRSGRESAVLCLREHVQHRQGGQGRAVTLLQ